MTLDNLNKVIEELESIDPNGEFAYEKAIHAFIKINQLPIFIHQIQEGLRICRARTHQTPELFKSIDSISIPPKKLLNEFARCNRPFQSKFYCSENRPTSLMELVEYWAETKEFGEKLYVTTGLWETKEKLSAIIITSPDIENRKSDFDRLHGKALYECFICKYSGEVQEAMKIFYRFLFEKFRKPAKKDLLTYIITTAYCNIALSESKGMANCILYPSVPFDGKGVNIAINSEFITDSNISLIGVMCNEFSISENELHKHSFFESNDWTAKKVLSETKEIVW